jgi:Protein of unknown function (DUF1236)
MRTKLLATAAAAALVGCTTFALAQTAQTTGGEGQSKGSTEQKGSAQHEMTPGGAGGTMGHGAQAPGATGREQGTGGSAQNQGSGEQNKGLSQTEEHNGAKQGENAKEGETGKTGKTGDTGTQEKNAQNQEHGGTQQNSAQTQERGGQSPQNAASENKGAGGKSVQLSDTQRTQIKSIIVRNHNVARVNNVNFDISVGTAVPRSIHFVVLPAEIVTIVPEYRGFDYIVVGDQLLIIDPNTLQIVAILPA